MKVYVTREQTYYEVFVVELDDEEFDGDIEEADQAAIDKLHHWISDPAVEQIDEGYRGDFEYEVE